MWLRLQKAHYTQGENQEEKWEGGLLISFTLKNKFFPGFVVQCSADVEFDHISLLDSCGFSLPHVVQKHSGDELSSRCLNSKTCKTLSSTLDWFVLRCGLMLPLFLSCAVKISKIRQTQKVLYLHRWAGVPWSEQGKSCPCAGYLLGTLTPYLQSYLWNLGLPLLLLKLRFLQNQTHFCAIPVSLCCDCTGQERWTPNNGRSMIC